MPRSRLYVLDGTSGVWKDELMDYTARRLSNAATIKKLTTRGPRPGEDFASLDLERVTLDGFRAAAPDYAYQYGGQWYGFTRTSLQSALRDKEHVFIIVRNAGVIRRLVKDFSRYCPTVAFVYVDSGLAERKAQEFASDLVKTGIRDAYNDYLREPELYDEVLIHADTSNDLYRLVDLLVARGVSKELIFVKSGRRLLPVAIATTGPTKALIVLLSSLILTLALGIGINVLTAGPMEYWQGLTLVLAGGIALLALLVNIAFIYGWQKRRD